MTRMVIFRSFPWCPWCSLTGPNRRDDAQPLVDQRLGHGVETLAHLHGRLTGARTRVGALEDDAKPIARQCLVPVDGPQVPAAPVGVALYDHPAVRQTWHRSR